jgi:hypothetical protein
MTTYGDMLSDLGGVPVRGPIRQGKNIFVNPYYGLDGNDGSRFDSARKTLTAALALIPANNTFKKGDTIYLLAQSNTGAYTTDYQTTTLVWDKDFTHLTGVNGSGSVYSPRCRIATSSAAAGADVAPLMTVSANCCEFQDIQIFAGAPASAPTSALGALLVSGDRNVFRRCHIGGCGDVSMDAATQFSLKVTGSENLFEDCTIGLDTVMARTLMRYEMYMGNATTPCARNVFRRCRFMTSAGSASMTWLTTLASGLQRTNKFIDCTWVNLPTGVGSGTTMTQAMNIADTSGALLFSGVQPFMGCTKIQTTGTAAVQITPSVIALAITNNI